MTDRYVAGFTSTGSKQPEVLFGPRAAGVPLRMVSAHGATVVASDGREYLDYIMALGAVALGYGHPAVHRAVVEASEQGVVGPLAPVHEEALASQLHEVMPWLESVRFLKSGAEAVSAAVRLARVVTKRDAVLGCGYHGWLDWCSEANGVPAATRALFGTIPFNDVEKSVASIRAGGDKLACVVIEPVIDAAPTLEWLTAVRNETHRVGAILIFDEIKTAFRIAIGGAAERWGVRPDLMVLGKALANGFPLAAFGGSKQLMARVHDTWISSTLATEFVSLAAASATVRVMREENVPEQLHGHGGALLGGLRQVADRHPQLVEGVPGIEEMCYLRYHDDAIGGKVATACAARGLLFKRSAYNFVSLAHDHAMTLRAIQILHDALTEVAGG